MLVCSALSQLLQRVAAQLCFWGSLAAFFGLLSTSSSSLPLPSASPHLPSTSSPLSLQDLYLARLSTFGLGSDQGSSQFEHPQSC